MKKCFTINPKRTKEEFDSYKELFEKDLFQAIEIFYPYSEPHKQLKDYTEKVFELKNLFPNLEIVLHLPHGVYNGLCKKEHLDSGSYEIMCAGMRFASQFGVKKLTLHLGSIDKTVERESYIDKLTPILKDLCEYANKFNQIIMIENMPGDNEFGYSPDELLKLFKSVNKPNLKFIFDTGHGHVSKYEDTSFLYTLKDYLYHLHYSDNDGTRDAHAKMGTGTIDFEKHFKVLKEINYQGLHCMEVIYHSVDDLKEYVKDFIKYED